MIKRIAGMLGIGVACAVCCAAPGLGSVMAWFGMLSLGSAGLAWWLGGAALLASVVVIGVLLILRRGKRAAAAGVPFSLFTPRLSDPTSKEIV